MAVWERKVRDEVNLHFALGASLDIVTLHDAFEDEAGVHLLIDLCDGERLARASTSNESDCGGSFASHLPPRRPSSGRQDERIDATHQSRSIESFASRSRRPRRR